MPLFKNVSPLGDLELPLVGRTIEFGETFEVTAAQAIGLEGQTSNWLPVGATPVDLLRSTLKQLGLSTAGKKSELQERLDTHLAIHTPGDAA